MLLVAFWALAFGPAPSSAQPAPRLTGTVVKQRIKARRCYVSEEEASQDGCRRSR